MGFSLGCRRSAVDRINIIIVESEKISNTATSTFLRQNEVSSSEVIGKK